MLVAIRPPRHQLTTPYGSVDVSPRCMVMPVCREVFLERIEIVHTPYCHRAMVREFRLAGICSTKNEDTQYVVIPPTFSVHVGNHKPASLELVVIAPLSLAPLECRLPLSLVKTNNPQPQSLNQVMQSFEKAADKFHISGELTKTP